MSMNAASKWVVVVALFCSAASIQAQTKQTDKKEADKKEAEKKADSKQAEKAITVPFELLKSRHIAVQVKINGKGPFRLIFDTGAPTNLVNTKIAKDSGLVKKEDKGGFGLFGMAGAKTIDTLEIGDAKLEKVQVMVMDHPTVAAISNALGPIEGLIGFPSFARYKTTIDYQKKEFTFEPNGYEPGDAMQSLMNKMMSGRSRANRSRQLWPPRLSGASAWTRKRRMKSPESP